jgi:cell division protein FtsB
LSVELRQRFLALRHKPATLGVGLLIAVLGYHVVFGANGLFVYQQKRKEFRALQGQIQHMKQQNATLEKQIKALKTDPQAIEKEARERLRYARPGEVIYSLPQAPPQLPQQKKQGTETHNP